MEIVKHFYGGYFLRDDFKIREQAAIEPKQAYSLFKKDPYERLVVFAGNLDWAIEETYKMIGETCVEE